MESDADRIAAEAEPKGDPEISLDVYPIAEDDEILEAVDDGGDIRLPEGDLEKGLLDDEDSDETVDLSPLDIETAVFPDDDHTPGVDVSQMGLEDAIKETALDGPPDVYDLEDEPALPRDAVEPPPETDEGEATPSPTELHTFDEDTVPPVGPVPEPSGDSESLDEQEERDLLNLLALDLGTKIPEPDEAADADHRDLMTAALAEPDEPASAAGTDAEAESAPTTVETPSEPDDREAADRILGEGGELSVTQAQLEASLERVIRKVFAEKIEQFLFDALEQAVAKEINKLKDVLLADVTVDE